MFYRGYLVYLYKSYHYEKTNTLSNIPLIENGTYLDENEIYYEGKFIYFIKQDKCYMDSDMAQELQLSPIKEKDIQVHTILGSFKEKEHINIPMEIFMKENLSITSLKEKEYISGQMEEYFKELSKMIGQIERDI